MKYATIDAKGIPTGFYDDSINVQIPADAVEIPEENWQAHLDGRPQQYVNGAWQDYVPSDEEQLAQAKSAKLAEIRQAYEKAISADIEYMNTAFQADPKSQDLIVKTLAASGGTLPDGFFWIDAANNQVPMTYADLQGLANAILLRGQQAFAKYQSLKREVNAATTVEEVEAIAW